MREVDLSGLRTSVPFLGGRDAVLVGYFEHPLPPLSGRLVERILSRLRGWRERGTFYRHLRIAQR
jgi:hypothetical protein